MKQRIESIESVNRRIIATLVRLEGKLDDLTERATTKDDLAAMSSRMDQRFDSVIAQLEDLRFGKAVHADTLMAHDARLKKLEGPGS